jgi:Fe-S-cluster containining protein
MRALSSILEKAIAVYARLDAAYLETAKVYDFVCRGCEENCCRSRFFHYTAIEHIILYEGLIRLPAGRREEVARRALEYNLRSAGGPAGILCPLNHEDRCMLYDQRPMICRLHGVPYHLRLPDGRFQAGAGCAAFEGRRDPAIEARLDRTPLYRALAELEQAARSIPGWTGKRRMTIAEMILTPPETWGPLVSEDRFRSVP